MPELITTTVYRLGELPPAAASKARDWYRRAMPEDDWYDSVFDDFERICSILGVVLTTRQIRLYGGGVRQQPNIWFSGFSSQGDGACFEGDYAYAVGAPGTIRVYAPQDDELHRIADALQAVQRRNFYQLEGRVRHEGRYYHEYTMAVTVERASWSGQDMTDGAEETVIALLRDLARWLYRSLEREFEYQTSDDVVDEAILAQDFSFTADGLRFP